MTAVTLGAAHPGAAGSALVLGIAATGIYGMLAISLVLTYRVSRSIGFVQGGIAIFATYLYWWLTTADRLSGHAAVLGRLPALVVVVAAGAAIGLAYGATTTGRLALWPRVRLTTYSLAWMLVLGSAVISLFADRFGRTSAVSGTPAIRAPVASLFGTGRYKLLGAFVTIHQVAILVTLLVLIAGLSVFLLRTRAGTFVRAIADDPEAARWVGVPLRRLGTGVYGGAGAVSALAGVFLATTVGPNFLLLIAIFLRTLVVSVLGGFTSLSLALIGCALVGLGETTLSAEVFGGVSVAQRELIEVGSLFVVIALINRHRRVNVLEAADQ